MQGSIILLQEHNQRAKKNVEYAVQGWLRSHRGTQVQALCGESTVTVHPGGGLSLTTSVT